MVYDPLADAEGSGRMSDGFRRENTKFFPKLGECIEVVRGDDGNGIFFDNRPTPEMYNGEYMVTPSPEAQVLETAKKIMKDDVTVKKIPFYNVSNTDGGSTVYIGKEVEINGNQ